MSPRKASATSGISPTDGIPLKDYPKQKRTAEKYKDNWDDEDEEDDEESLKGSSPRSEVSRYTIYKEQIGYVSPRDHREMELHLARVQGGREVVGRTDHFIGPASKAKTGSIVPANRQSSQKNPNMDSIAESQHLVYGQSRRNRSNDTVTQGRRDEEPAPASTSPLTRKQQQILGIGVKYPEPPPGIRRSPHTSTEAYQASPVSTASYISGVSSGYGAPSVSTARSKTPSTLTIKQPEPPKDKKSNFKFPSFSKEPKPVKQKPRLGGRLIEHVTHNVMKELNNYIAVSSDKQAVHEEHMPRIMRRYGAEIAIQRSEEYLASRSGSASNSSSNRSSESATRTPHPLRAAQSSYSIGGPNPPFAKGIMHRHSADTLHTPSSKATSRAQPPKRNTSTVASQVLSENPDNDNRFWFNTITENDISFPTHRAMREVLPNSNAAFIRPGWLAAERTQPGPDEYIRAQDLEIHQITEGIPEGSLSINRAPRKKSSNISQTHRNSDTSNGMQSVRTSDPRSESRWSAYSDEEPQKSGHSWRQPLSWGTTRKKGLYHTYESRGSNEAMVSNTTSPEVPSTTTASKFKLFGSNFSKKASKSKVGSSNYVSASSDLSARTGQVSSTESILGRIDPETYEDPHPGSLVMFGPSPLEAAKVLQDPYVSTNPAKKEGGEYQRRLEELERRLFPPVETASNPDFRV
ncbi:hypothetical protein BGX38DRAFT_1139947 [Terfezia claveryi]|nr:hypothetical protein BGX38DRAFT_1139947 [Terfezia claveryi]